MAQPTNTYDTYDLAGDREDLADYIYDISPMETPLFTSATVKGTHATNFEWQEDALAAAAANQNIEGDDTTAGALVATTRRGNYAQILKKAGLISGTARAIDTAGRADEYAYQVAKLGREMKRDAEFMIGANNGAVAGNSSTARETGGLGAFLYTNTSFKSDGSPAGADPSSSWTTPTAARTDDGGTRAFSETILKAVMKSCYDNGATPSMLVVGSWVKQVASGFTGIAANRVNFTGARTGIAIGAVDIYVSDFGELKITPDRFTRGRDAWFIDPEYLALRELRPMQIEELAKTGDGDKFHIIWEVGLEAHEAAHGGAFDLATA